MTRSRQGIALIVAVLGIAAFAAGADAKPKRHPAAVAPRHHYDYAGARTRDFPSYVDHGVDRNPGSDNLYFSDTKRPSYIVGPAWFQRWD